MDNSHLNFAVRTLPLVVGEDEGEKESEDGIEGESEHGTEDEGESEDDGEQLEPRALLARVLVVVLAVLPASLLRSRARARARESEDEREGEGERARGVEFGMGRGARASARGDGGETRSNRPCRESQ